MTTAISRRSFLSALGGTMAVALTARRVGFAQDAATPVAGAITHPTGANEIVLRISVGGGFMPISYSLSALPFVSLYGDGTLINEGPTTMIFPPAALPNLRQTKLTEAGIQAVLAGAQKAGLLDGDKTYRNDIVADAPTTVFTTNANGKKSVVSAYALGLDEDPNLPEDEKTARAALRVFYGSVLGLYSSDPSFIAEPVKAYAIERLQIVAELIDPSAGTPEAGYSPEIVWPLATSLADATPADEIVGKGGAYRCGILDGEDARTVIAAARNATTLTPWLSGEDRYLVSFRPLLVDELGCPPTVIDPNATPVAQG